MLKNQLLNNPSKMNSNSSNMKMAEILSKPRKEPNRIIKIDMIPSQVLDYDTDVMELCKFSVKESGYYKLSNQTCLSVQSSTSITVIQYGICDKNLEDFGQCIDSKLLNTNAPADTIISNNLSTFKLLEADKEYIVWINVSSGKNSNLMFMNDYSHTLLIKL